MSSNQDVIVEVSLEVLQKARQALETCRVRSISEWEVTEITPRHVLEVIENLDGILSFRGRGNSLETNSRGSSLAC